MFNSQPPDMTNRFDNTAAQPASVRQKLTIKTVRGGERTCCNARRPNIRVSGAQASHDWRRPGNTLHPKTGPIHEAWVFERAREVSKPEHQAQTEDRANQFSESARSIRTQPALSPASGAYHEAQLGTKTSMPQRIPPRFGGPSGSQVLPGCWYQFARIIDWMAAGGVTSVLVSIRPGVTDGTSNRVSKTHTSLYRNPAAVSGTRLFSGVFPRCWDQIVRVTGGTSNPLGDRAAVGRVPWAKPGAERNI